MNEIMAKEDERIEDMIYEIRGKQVMFDFDLAKVYQCKNGTKEINQAVKNNPDKFPERFSWKLTDGEVNDFLVKYFDQKMETRGGRYKNPRVFTEQGVAMLSTILKSEVAIKVSIAIMDAFVTMRKYISNNLLEQNYIKSMVIRHDEEIKNRKTNINVIENKDISSLMKVNDREGISMDEVKIYTVSPEAIGLNKMSIKEIQVENKVKVRKRTRSDLDKSI